MARALTQAHTFALAKFQTIPFLLQMLSLWWMPAAVVFAAIWATACLKTRLKPAFQTFLSNLLAIAAMFIRGILASIVPGLTQLVLVL